MRAKDIYVSPSGEVRLVIDLPLDELFNLSGMDDHEFEGELKGSVFRLIKWMNQHIGAKEHDPTNSD